MTAIFLSKKEENENVRGNLLLIFFPFVVCLLQKNKKNLKKSKDRKRKEDVDVAGVCHSVSLSHHEFFHKRSH